MIVLITQTLDMTFCQFFTFSKQGRLLFLAIIKSRESVSMILY